MDRRLGFTFLELLAVLSILGVIVGGLFFASIVSQRYLKGSSAFISVTGSGRNSIERIIRPIRQANSINVTNDGNRVEIRYDENDTPTQDTDDDTNIAFYYNEDNNTINYDDDNDPDTDDRILASNVVKLEDNNIFTKGGKEISIIYKVLDPYDGDGYQAQDISTTIMMRN